MVARILILAFFVVGLTSCKKDKEQKPSTPPTSPYVIENFLFKDIKYLTSDSSRIMIDSTLIFQRTFDNNSSSDMDVIVGLPDQMETSKFASAADTIVIDKTSPIKFSVPISIKDGEIITGTPDWTFDPGITELKIAPLVNQKLRLKIKSMTREIVSVHAKWQKISSKYTATVAGKKTGKITKIDNIWHGMQLKGFTTTINSSDL